MVRGDTVELSTLLIAKKMLGGGSNNDPGESGGGVASIDDIIAGTATDIRTNATIIPNNRFRDNSPSLRSFDGPNVTHIGAYGFNNCDALAVVNLPKLETTENYAMSSCDSLINVSLPNLKVIGDNCFRSNRYMKTLYAPLVETVGREAFKDCFEIESVDFPNATTVAYEAFFYCKLQSVNLPKVTGYVSFSGCEFTTIDLLEVTSLGVFTNCKYLKTVNAPKASPTIPVSCFDRCVNIESITLSGPITAIRQSAFNYCTNMVAIPFDTSSVTTVNYNAFYGCGKLASADFSLITKIEKQTFSGCSSLNALILRSETLVTLDNINALSSTPIAKGTGYVYVPRSLLNEADATSDYRQATNWSTYGTQFRALEDYTVDGTITGTLDPTKI